MLLLGVTTGDHTSKANFVLISSSLSEASYIKMIFKVFESHWDFVISYQKQLLTDIPGLLQDQCDLIRDYNRFFFFAFIS